MRRIWVSLVAALTLAAMLAGIPAGVSPAGAQAPPPDPFTCEFEAVAAGFDVSWQSFAGADKYVVQRTVDADGPYWRGVVDAPGLTFDGDAVPAQGGTVAYEVWVKDVSGAVITSVPCDEASTTLTCEWVLTAAGYEISWTAYPGAAKYRVQRTVDAAGPYARATVDAPGLSFEADPVPAQGGVVAYSVQPRNAANTALVTVPCSDGTEPLTCTFVPTGTGFDVAWSNPGGADEYRVYRTVDAAGPYWRGMVPAPGEVFSDTAASSGAVVAYEVKAVVGTVVGAAVPCEELPEVVAGSCEFVSTDTGYTVRWVVPAGTVDVVMVRSVDGGNYNWRGKVGVGTHRFDDGPLPAAATSVNYRVRLETNSGPEIVCDDGGVFGPDQPAGSFFRPDTIKSSPPSPVPLPVPAAAGQMPPGTVSYASNSCAVLNPEIPILHPGDWATGFSNQVRTEVFGYIWVPNDYKVRGTGFIEVTTAWQDVAIGHVINKSFFNFAQDKDKLEGMLGFDNVTDASLSGYPNPPGAVSAPGGRYIVAGFHQRWGYAPTGQINYLFKHMGLVADNPANPAPMAPAPCTAFADRDIAKYDWQADVGVLFGEDWLDNLEIQAETLVALGLGFIPGYDCVDAIVNGVNGWNAAGCVADLLAAGITLDILRSAGNISVTVREGDDIYGLIDEIPAAQWADELEGAPSTLDNLAALCSFTGDTNIIMADGTTKPLVDVTEGDWVRGLDQSNNSFTVGKVVYAGSHQDTVFDIALNEKWLSVTEDHPFWTKSTNQWLQAGDLEVGTKLLSANDSETLVSSIDWDSFRSEEAFSISVATISTYFVSIDGESALVHNCPPNFGNLKKVSASQFESAFGETAHAFKVGVLGQGAPIAQFDIYRDGDVVYLVRKTDSTTIETGYTWP